MHAYWFALGAAMLYGTAGVMLEKLFPNTHPFTLMIVYLSTILLITIPARMLVLHTVGAGEEIRTDFPTGTLLLWLVGIGLVLFFADYCYVRALTNGGKAYVVALVLSLMPIFALLVAQLWDRTIPNKYEVVAFLLSMLAIGTLAYGSLKSQ